MTEKVGAMVAGSPAVDLWATGELKVEGQRAVPILMVTEEEARL